MYIFVRVYVYIYLCIYNNIYFKYVYLSTNHRGSHCRSTVCPGALAKALPCILQNDAIEVSKAKVTFKWLWWYLCLL